MPTYEYACLSCGQHIEVYQRFSDEPLSTCGVCGGELRKVFHPAGILFKGSGFYKTDSRLARAGGSSQQKPEKEAAEQKPRKEAAAGSGSSGGEGSGAAKAGKAGGETSAGSASKEKSA